MQSFQPRRGDRTCLPIRVSVAPSGLGRGAFVLLPSPRADALVVLHKSQHCGLSGLSAENEWKIEDFLRVRGIVQENNPHIHCPPSEKTAGKRIFFAFYHPII